MTRAITTALGAALVLLLSAVRAEGQDTLVHQFRTTYNSEAVPGFVVLPFTPARGSEAAAGAVRGILRRDLELSDRFRVEDGARAARPGDAVELAGLAERGVDWVLAGEVAPRGGGLTLRVGLYDPRYGRLEQDRSFALPGPRDPGFRMAVHAVSDEVVRWATGEPGMAATRIAFVRQGRGAKEIYVVDSDGENLQRVTVDGSIALSPAWSPDGRRIAYTSFREGTPALYERDLASGSDRVVSRRDGINITPAYSPDGKTLAFAATVDGSTEVVAYDLSRGCCPEPLTRGKRFDSLSPTWSPDGKRIAFVSNRLGEPHVYVMQPGGEARLLSEFRYGTPGYNTSPDWSPRGGEIAYHTRVNGRPQVAVVGAGGGARRVLTSGGSNEDPSWAPDGRHVVFSSSGGEGGLFVVDTVSGRIRPLLRGAGYGLPDWSPTLAENRGAPPAGR